MEKQAAVVGLRFDPTLSESILAEVKGEPGAMPLLQHALWELWNRRHGLWIKAEEYQAFGGVKQAIASTAEEVYASCSDFERARVRDIFLRLTRLDESGEGRDTRRRVLIEELIPVNSDSSVTLKLLNKLADARLIVKTDKDVEVAHEALIRHWSRLTEWLNEDRDNLRLREGVSESAREWENSKRDDSLLNHRGGRLELALAMSKLPRYQLNPIEQTYLNACIGSQEKARIEKERIKLLTYIGVFITTLILIVLLYDPIRTEILKQKAKESQRENIPAGNYLLGDNTVDESNQYAYLPRQNYFMSSYSIDIYPVTNKRYLLCAKAGICSKPNGLQSEYAKPEKSKNLVTNITAINAAEFCDWIGMRLPSDKEWELAAQKRIFKSINNTKHFYEWTRSPYTLDSPEWLDISTDPPSILTLKGGLLDENNPFEKYITKREGAASTQPNNIFGFRCAVGNQ